MKFECSETARDRAVCNESSIMKKIVTLIFVCILCSALAYGAVGVSSPKLVDLPEEVRLKISAENEVQLEDVNLLPGGTVGFNGAYVSAVVFDDSIKNCSIFVYSNGGLYGAYGGAPCEFIGAAEIDLSDGLEVPDVYYKVNVFSSGLGASVNDLVAFYYDASTKSFCESRLLSTWRFNGKINIRPKLSDGICGAVN